MLSRRARLSPRRGMLQGRGARGCLVNWTRRRSGAAARRVNWHRVRRGSVTKWSCRELDPPEERRSRPAGELASGKARQRNEVELPGIGGRVQVLVTGSHGFIGSALV